MPPTIATASDLFCSPLRRRYSVVGPLPVMGCHCRIRSLTEREMSSYQSAIFQSSGMKKARLEDAGRRLIALCLVDDQGNPICTPEHVATMADWDAADSHFLYNACAAHCGIKAEEIEDLVKNCEATSDGSSR